MRRSGWWFFASSLSPASLRGRLFSTLICLFFGLGVFTSAARAQTAGTGALAGSISDPSAASVAEAQVKATNEATGEVRTALSNAAGNYILMLLPPGLYELEISRQGFKLVHVSHLHVDVTETTTFNVRMELGQMSEKVIVEAHAEQLQTESSALGRITTGEQVQILPLAVGNFTQIIGLNPGVAAEVNDAGQLGRGGGGNNQAPTVSNGNWASDNNFQMNGVGVNDNQQSGFFSAGVAIPNPDSIEEFKVQTGQFDAGYGRNAGANVDVITKGGTKDFHGEAFEFFRNEDLNANSFFRNSAGQPRPVLKQNRFGGNFGGPIKAEKLFFFTSYQGTRQRNGLDSNCSANVTQAPLTNDRSAAGLGQLFGGQTGLFGGAAIAADGSNINPVALSMLNLKLPNGQFMIPTPQKVNPSAAGGFDAEGFSAYSQPCPFTEDQFMTNADYLKSEKSKLMGRFFFANSAITYTLPTTNLTGGGSPPGFPVNLTQNFRNFSLTHNYIFGPNLVNQAEIAFHRILGTFVQGKSFSFSQVGAQVVPFDNTIPAIAINVLGSTGLSLGGNGQTVEIAQNFYTFQDSLSWTHGKHSFRFGGGASREQNNQIGFHYLMGEGFATWADFLLGLSGAPQASGGNGSGVSNVLVAIDLLGFFDRAYRNWYAFGFAQDDIKLTKRLTFNIGLRYDRIGDFGDTLGRNASFDASLADRNPPAAGTLAGTTVPSNFQGTVPTGVKKLSNDYAMNGVGQNTWNPRLGFAYQLPHVRNRMVLRGGYGVFHSRDTGQPFIQLLTAPPFGQIREALVSPTPTEQVPLPLNPPTFPAFIPYSPSTSNTITVFDPNYRPPMIQEYSLGTETQLTPSMVLEVAYSGARGLHVIRERSINQANLASPSNPIRGETTSTLANLPLRVPFEGWSPSLMQQIESAGATWYNALLVSLNKRFSHGLQLQASYTFSKDLATDFGTSTGANGGSSAGNQNDPKSRYGPDNFIRPHRLILNYLYQFPSFSKQNAFVRQALGGWALVGVTTVQDGHRLTVLYFNGANILGTTNDRAQLSGTCTPGQYVSPGSVSSNIGGSKTYINKSCFTAPLPISDGLGFGNAGVGILKGPGQVNFDFSAIKRFSLRWPRESANLEFRSEFFNIFNHPQFLDPDVFQNDATFGQITNTAVNPRIVQFAMKLKF